MQFVGLQSLADFDPYHDFIIAGAETSEFNNELCEYERELEEDNEGDAEYKAFLLNMLTMKKRVESNRKRREKDEEHNNNLYHEEENDPYYELFLNSLKEHEKSYILEGKENGLPVVIKYEGDSGSDNECSPEPRRKLRSAMKQKDGTSNQMPGLGNQPKHDSQSTPTKETKKRTWRRSRNKSESEKEENVKLSSIVPDSDYLTFIQDLKVVDGHYVYKYGDHTIVYELKDGENNQKKEEDSDGSFSDVQILDSNSFYKGLNLYNSTMNKGSNLNFRDIIDTTRQSEFRHKVITILRKPYDEEEYGKLWQGIKFRKPEGRHIELRNGRERSYATQKDGRSYLDHYPEFERKLLQVRDDKSKCLNLLRGFFFFLEHPASFRPWEDPECLAINPGSG